MYALDKKRGGTLPLYQYWYRKANACQNLGGKRWKAIPLLFYKTMLRITLFMYHCEISSTCSIGPGLSIGHPYGITINHNAKIGKNCNIHKGVTIGQENRGKRKGTPIIGNRVWIGINSTIVGNIKIGDDVLIAPNSYINCDIPNHSIVYGNPCTIKSVENATEHYIENTI